MTAFTLFHYGKRFLKKKMFPPFSWLKQDPSDAVQALLCTWKVSAEECRQAPRATRSICRPRGELPLNMNVPEKRSSTPATERKLVPVCQVIVNVDCWCGKRPPRWVRRNRMRLCSDWQKDWNGPISHRFQTLSGVVLDWHLVNIGGVFSPWFSCSHMFSWLLMVLLTPTCDPMAWWGTNTTVRFTHLRGEQSGVFAVTLAAKLSNLFSNMYDVLRSPSDVCDPGSSLLSLLRPNGWQEESLMIYRS